jgi:hypothetical protein
MTSIVALVLAAAPYWANNFTDKAFDGNSAITPATSLGPSNRKIAEKLCAA